MWPIEGASAANRTAGQTLALETLCAVATGAAVLDGCVWEVDTGDDDDSRGLVDLVELVPFDVQIAVTGDSGLIEMFEVSNVVTDWMNEGYRSKLEEFGYTEENRYAEFDSVVLFDNSRRQRERNLQTGELYTAQFKGGALFTRNAVRTESVPENDVLLIQQVTLLNDTALTALLQQSSAPGLGSAVVDVNAFLNPTADDDNGDDGLCGTALNASDADQNSALSVEEYAEFVQTNYYDTIEDCQIDTSSTSLTDLQAATYSTLACADCLTSQDGNCNQCGEGPIGIEGANLAVENRTLVQRTRLGAVCTAARTSAEIDCALEGFEPIPAPNPGPITTLSPSFNIDADLATCAADLNGADGDGNEFLNRTEYAAFLEIRYGGDRDCALPPDNVLLSAAQEAVFGTLACASCLGDFQECGCGTDAARFAIRGASDPDPAQLLILRAACAAADGAAAVDCALDTDNDNNNNTDALPTASPTVMDDTTGAPAVGVVNGTTPTVVPSPTISPGMAAPAVDSAPVTVAPVVVDTSGTPASSLEGPTSGADIKTYCWMLSASTLLLLLLIGSYEW